jgi:hypothetical protein
MPFQNGSFLTKIYSKLFLGILVVKAVHIYIVEVMNAYNIYDIKSSFSQNE